MRACADCGSATEIEVVESDVRNGPLVGARGDDSVRVAFALAIGHGATDDDTVFNAANVIFDIDNLFNFDTDEGDIDSLDVAEGHGAEVSTDDSVSANFVGNEIFVVSMDERVCSVGIRAWVTVIVFDARASVSSWAVSMEDSETIVW